MAIIHDLRNSNLSLKGITPPKQPGTTKLSDTHVLDNRPGQGGNELYKIKSELDLDGKTPPKYIDNPPQGAAEGF